MPARPLVEKAAAWWRAQGWQVEIAATRGPGEAVTLAGRAAAEEFDMVVVAGGDGTLSEAANGLAGSATALGLLPFGTANIWAREVGLKPLGEWGAPPVETYARLIADSTARPVDLGKVGSRYFLLWLGVGLDGHIVSRVEPRRRLAKWLGLGYYAAAAFVAAWGWTGAPMEITVDDRSISGHMLLVLVGNNRRYAGRLFMVSPQARMDDGLLEVWTFRGRDYGAALSKAWALLLGRHVDHPDINYYCGREITISSPEPVPSQVDGDRLGAPVPLRVSVVSKALRLLVPPGAPPELFGGEPMI
jgi:YegS/Rv2252/BmrU family lipid kinase